MMIKRIVKMEFRSEEIENFKTLFDKNKEKIRNFKGCTHLELWQDIKDNSIFMTYSYWESEEDLNNYRHSELFNLVWSSTKILFRARPVAWSVNTIHKLN